MPDRRNASLALSALVAAALACGPGSPSGPTTDSPTGGDGSGGSGSGGSGAGGDGSGGGATGGAGSGGSGSGGSGGTTDGGPAGGTSGGSAPSVGTAFAVVLGGAGNEWTQDVAAAPGGEVVALTVVGPRPSGGFDQLGLTRISGGAAQPGRLYDVGAPVSFPRDGALSVGPGGEVYLALTAQCGTGCRGLGAPVNGSALVQLSSGGDPRWTARLAGAVASQPVVDPAGNVAVATSEGGANVVRSFTASGAQRWEARLAGAAATDAFLAADAGANVIVGRGGEVVKLGPSGAVAWSRPVGVQVSGVAGTASGAVIVAGTGPGGPAVLELGPDGADGPAHPLPGPASDVRVEVGMGTRIGAVTGTGGCGATVTAIDVGGDERWTRSAATSGCDGSQLRLAAVTVTTTGVVVVGGALDGTVDLGGGPVPTSATDALVAGFGP